MSGEYNYAHFPQNIEGPVFQAFPTFLRVGAEAPDGEVTRLDDGARVRLSEYWRSSPLVIEFGSIT